VFGTEWYVQLSKDLPKNPPLVQEIYTYFSGAEGGIRIGDTSTVTGVLQVLDALCVLIDYLVKFYLPWLAKLLDAVPDGARSEGKMLAPQLHLLDLQEGNDDAEEAKERSRDVVQG
jgi:hypothetical protein